MKVVAFNASPRKEQGVTDRILKLFIEGMQEAGAEVELIYLAGKKIGYCTGTFACWLQTPGVCIIKDDMTEILVKLREADMVVYGTPVYLDGMTAQMKTLLDRSLPLLQPLIEIRDGHVRHPMRYPKRQKMVVVSTCGLTEMDNFDPMITHFKAAAKNLYMEYIGALVRPAGVLLDIVAQSQPEKVESIYNAIKRAGYEVVAEGRMSPQTMEAAAQELIPQEAYMNQLNTVIQPLLELIERQEKA